MRKLFYKYKAILVYLLFLLIAFLFIVYPLHRQVLMSCDDSFFTMQRLQEICRDVLHLQIPRYDQFSGIPLGADISVMYPWLFLAPFALFIKFFSPIALWCLVIATYIFIGLLIAFYTFKRTMRANTYSSLFFAILYCTSCQLMGWVYLNSDLGAMIAIMFAPLAFFGWIDYLRYNHWKMMTVGLILMAYSHIISVLIMALFLALETVFERSSFKTNYIKIGLKSLLITLLSTALVWLPIIIISMYNKFDIPTYDFLDSTNELFPSWSRMMHPFNMRGWSFVDLIAIVIIIISLRHLKSVARILFLSAIGLIILNYGKLWYFFVHFTPIQLIQFSFRFDFIIDLILIWLLTVVLFQSKEFKRVKALKVIVMGIILLTDVWCVGLSNYQVFNHDNGVKRGIRFDLATHYNQLAPIANNYNYEHNPEITHRKVAYDYFPNNFEHQQQEWNADLEKVNKKQYVFRDVGTLNNPNTSKMKVHNNRYVNYYSNKKNIRMVNWRSILSKDKQHLIIMYRKILPFKYHSRGGIVTVKKNNSNVLIPYAMYHNQSYYVLNNGHITSFHKYKGSILQLNHLTKGQHKITVYAPLMWYNYLALLISLIGIISLTLM